MIIYLEGPDGSGKSTLVDSIVDVLEGSNIQYMNNAKILVSTYPKDPDRLNEKQLFVNLKKMANSNTVYILDRCFISDCVYRVFDNYKPVTTLHKCIEFLQKYNNRVYTIYCRTANAEEYMLKRGDDNPIAIQKHKEITRVYDLVMSLISSAIKYNYFKYDFTKKRSINELLGAISYFVYMNTK
jgi:thymidylate kinase